MCDYGDGSLASQLYSFEDKQLPGVSCNDQKAESLGKGGVSQETHSPAMALKTCNRAWI